MNLTTIFEQTKGQETPEYEQVIAYFSNLATVFPSIHIQEIGMTDAGLPLHLVTLNPDKVFDFAEIRKQKRILFINNGIHPGEPDGIDATMMLYRDIAQGKIKMPKHTVLATIPVYNIGGCLNRNSHTRANQNGPAAYGFRGNARNYDLNRDFVKADSKNAAAFAKVFHLLRPDVFIDNHVSNGADYQYVLTHLFTQHNKLGGELGQFLHQVMIPELESSLVKKHWNITPYVNVFNEVPESGFEQFLDSPRYSTGYTTLWNTLGMMVETHMLKPYFDRVIGNYELMISMLEFTEKHGDQIKLLRQEAFAKSKEQKSYTLRWEVDNSMETIFPFKGYEGQEITSEITGQKRLKYDRSKPFTKDVSFKNYYKPTLTVKVPKAYIIPKAWWNIIQKLTDNHVKMSRLKADTLLEVESYRIEDIQSVKWPFEGHYLHTQVDVTTKTTKVLFHQGDYIVETDQPGFRYIMEVLEPQGPDSFFAWNYFDMILAQKENFSPYIFEDSALEILENDAQLKANFSAKKTTDSAFAKNWYAQLEWIFHQSKFYEKDHLQYPIFRMMH